MSYRVEQKIGNHTYVYEVIGRWDPKKKQARQTRKYLGKKDPITGEIITPRKSIMPRSTRDFGAIYLVTKQARSIGLIECLESVFGEEATDLFNLAAFQLIESKPLYLFKDWVQSSHIDRYGISSSQDISRYLQDIGERDFQRRQFVDRWGYSQPASKAVVFDITSLSSYGKMIDLLEWGYNRDSEKLPQVNLGMAMRIPDGIPLSYMLYPGSINDVSTLKNLIIEMNARKVRISRFVLDRGFYSGRNIRAMAGESIPFLLPLPFRTKLASKLIQDSLRSLPRGANGFVCNGQALFHEKKDACIEGVHCEAHIFLDEERKAREVTILLRRLSEIENALSEEEFSSVREARKELQDKAGKLAGYFRIAMVDGKAVLVRKDRLVSRQMNRHGKTIILSRASKLSREEILHLYRRKDMVEKLFDTLKNELHANRIRIHSRESLEGRLFVNFLSLILYFSLYTKRKDSAYLKDYSVPEIIKKMSVLRSVEMSNGKCYLSEVSKKQRNILQSFQIPIPEFPCY